MTFLVVASAIITDLFRLWKVAHDLALTYRLLAPQNLPSICFRIPIIEANSDDTVDYHLISTRN